MRSARRRRLTSAAFLRRALIPRQGPPPRLKSMHDQRRIAKFDLSCCAQRRTVQYPEDCLAANALVAAKLALRGMVRTVHHVEQFESPYLLDCQQRSVAAADLVLSVSEATRREVWAASVARHR